MNTQMAFDQLVASGVMAGMRGDFPPETALRVTTVLMGAGINVFEFTMNSTDPIEAMQAVKREFGDSVVAGMGTVLDVQTANRVIDAGADFIVSPALNPQVVKVAQDSDILMGPGVMTPTECANAWDLGVKILKIFPIGALGVNYFKAVRGPLDHMNFMANGGINPETTRAMIAAGAVAVGAAGWLTGDGTTPLDTVRQRAQQLVQAVEEGRSGERIVKV